MRLLLIALTVAFAGCGPNPDPPKRARKQPPPAPGVSKTITLPGEDGRVHIIDVPGRYETSRCLVHVGASGSNMVCLPAQDFAPLEHAPDN